MDEVTALKNISKKRKKFEQTQFLERQCSSVLKTESDVHNTAYNTASFSSIKNTASLNNKASNIFFNSELDYNHLKSSGKGFSNVFDAKLNSDRSIFDK
jgi:hypothetical protein